MTTQTEALKLALEAMQSDLATYHIPPTSKMLEAITAIKEALAQPEQDPVAYCEIHYLPEPCAQCAKEHEGYNTPPQRTEQEPVEWDGDCVLGHCGSPAGCEASNCCRADYTTPPQRKPLTDEQRRAIVAKLSEADYADGDEWDSALIDEVEAAHGITE